MPAVLNTNAASLYASKSLQSAQSKMATSVERLSSGLRVNRAKDDAAGLGIANALTSQINSANQGIRNLNDGISIVQTAEGAIAAAQEMGQRILTLATQGANGTMGASDRTAIKSEMKQLLAAIEAIGNRTKFSGIGLLNTDARATATTKFSLQASHQTNDVVALASNAFTNIGGFSSAAQIFSSAASSTSTDTALSVASTTGIKAGMSVIDGSSKITAGTLVTVVNTANTTGLTLDTNVAANPTGVTITFGDRVVANKDSLISLVANANPPQSIVGTTAYKIQASDGAYVALGTVKTVSGNDVTITGGSSTVAFLTTDVIVFSGTINSKT
jgi:flagellin